jgi:hypothetical protein
MGRVIKFVMACRHPRLSWGVSSPKVAAGRRLPASKIKAPNTLIGVVPRTLRALEYHASGRFS